MGGGHAEMPGGAGDLSGQNRAVDRCVRIDGLENFRPFRSDADGCGLRVNCVSAGDLRAGGDFFIPQLIVLTDEQSHDRVPDPEKGRGYMINLASNQHGVGYGVWTYIDGWSEAVITYIRELELLDD